MDEAPRMRRNIRFLGAQIGGHRDRPTLGADVKVTVTETLHG